MRKQVIIGSASGGLQIILNSILILITIPVFISRLGLTLYSIFSLLLLIGNLNVFLNLGLNSSLVKYLAEQGKSIQSNYDIAANFIFLSSIVFPLTIIGIYFNDFILINIFNIDEQLITPDVTSLFNLLFISNSIILIGQIFSAVLDSQQKVYLSNFVQIIYNFIFWGLILFCLLLGTNLYIIGISILFATLVWGLLLFYLFIKEWGSIKLKGINNNFIPALQKQFSYGSKLYISGSISFFYEPFTKILISHFIGLNDVAFFDIALKVRNQIWNLIGKLFYPIFPLIAKLSDKNTIRNLIHDIEQKAAFLIIPILVSVIFVTEPFIKIWIGDNTEKISTTTIYIVSAFLIGSLVIPNYQYLMAKGHPGKTIIIQSTNVFVNSFLFFIALPSLGYYSAVLSNVGAIISSFILCLYYQKKYLDSLIFDSLEQLFKFLIIVIVNVFWGFLVYYLVENIIVKIVLIPFTLIILSVIIYRHLRIFTSESIFKYSGQESLIGRAINRILIK